MKRFGGLLAIGLVAVFALVIPQGAAAQTACQNTEQYGAVRLFLPDLPREGDYWFWVRMQYAQTQVRIVADISGQICADIAADNLPPNQWSWQSYAQNGSSVPVRFADTRDNVITLIGVQAGVRVDKVLLTEVGCVPQDFGTNCNTSVEATAQTDDVIVLPPPSSEAVSGKVMISMTPLSNQANLQQVNYVVGGRTLQSSTGPDPFDTTLLPNGKHTIQIETLLKDGTIIRESTVIDVENPTNLLSPAVRWARLQQRSILTLAVGISSILLLSFVAWTIRRLYLKRRERKFHGF